MTRKLKAQDRRPAIAEAAIPVFARHGFAGATTKKLAEAAGVSEALLYKYFPSKEAIYQEIVRSTVRSLPKRLDGALGRLGALKPSTEWLICRTHVWAHQFLVLDGSEQQEDFRNIHRLILNSLKEDGEFARRVFKQVAQEHLVGSKPPTKRRRRPAILSPGWPMQRMHSGWSTTRSS